MSRVVVTGVGLVTPLATGTEDTWNGLVEGRSAIGPIKRFDPSSLRTQIGAEAEDLNGKDWVKNRRSLRMMTHADLMAVAATTLAVQDSGFEITEEAAEDCAVFVGSNKEVSDVEKMIDGLTSTRDEQGVIDIRRFGEEGMRDVYPLFYVEGLQAGSLFFVSEGFGLKGENTYFAGTAEAGGVAVGRAFRAIKRGETKVALAGGFDDPVSWWSMAKMDAMDFMTGSNERGEAACRPYDRDRDGTVMGEGAAFFVLEELESAKARGATPYAEIAGFGSGFDPNYIIKPDREGSALARTIEKALAEGGINADEVGYIAAHGEATRDGDVSEAHAIRSVFGEANGAVGSSVKGATGHLVAGAGALNAAVAALTLRHGAVPPTLNLEHEDPDCDALDWVPGEAREARPRAVLALARGFEGQQVALAMRAVD